MMVNSSQVSYFTLGAYFDPGPFRWLYFFIIMSVYFLIVLSNLLLIVVICLNTTLHEPMYIFLCSLLINEIYGCNVLCPFFLFQILKDVHTIFYSLCLLQVFSLYTYGAVNLINLAVMSYDRYEAICFPLQYHTRMNSRKVAFLILLIWLSPIVPTVIMIFLAASLTLCGNVIDKVYCDNYSIVLLSCFDTTINNMYELLAATLFITVPFGVIFFTYIQILRVCFNGSKQTRQKALSTCTPHLCCLVNFSFGAFFQITETRFDMSHLPRTFRIMTSVYHVICEPLFNPLIYGLNLSKIRNACKGFFIHGKNKATMMETK